MCDSQMVSLGKKTDFMTLKTKITNAPLTKASAVGHTWLAAGMTMARKDDDWDDDWDDDSDDDSDDKDGILTEFKEL